MIRDKKYRTNSTFEKHMLHNMNHKLVPIQREGHASSTVQSKLHIHSYYTIASSIARKREFAQKQTHKSAA